MHVIPPPSLGDGGGGPPKAWRGQAHARTALGIAPSTMLRMVPLPRFAEEDRSVGTVPPSRLSPAGGAPQDGVIRAGQGSLCLEDLVPPLLEGRVVLGEVAVVEVDQALL